MEDFGQVMQTASSMVNIWPMFRRGAQARMLSFLCHKSHTSSVAQIDRASVRPSHITLLTMCSTVNLWQKV